MGVHGLWRLIEPSGKPVPLETLENKVLAVDVSIWLHQAIKGFQDSKGAPLPNAHLLGIYHRVCKLLYFKIKPVFVFDGGVPLLKKQTIAKRNQLKSRNQTEADRLQKQLINTLLKHTAITNVLSEKTKATISSSPPKKSPGKSKPDTIDELFALPTADFDSATSSSDEEYSEDTSDSTPNRNLNIHNIDTESKEFKSLPADVRYELLSEVKETRKQSSWGRLHELPTKSDDFSSYQMGRLLQRQNVQSELEKTEKEMGGHSLSLGELESLMKDQGVITKNENIGKRIASDENTRYLLIKDVKQAIEEARKEQILIEKASKDGEDEETIILGDKTEDGAAEKINKCENNPKEENNEQCQVIEDKTDKDQQDRIELSNLEKDGLKYLISTDERLRKSSDYTRKSEDEYEGDLHKAIILSTHNNVKNSETSIATSSTSTGECSSRQYKSKADLEYENDLQTAIRLSKLAKIEEIEETESEHMSSSLKSPHSSSSKSNVDLEDDEDLQKAIQLSLECVPGKSNKNFAVPDSQMSFTDSFNISIEEDSESSDDEPLTRLMSAQNYMKEYSGLTPNEIAKIIRQNCSKGKTEKIITKKIERRKTKRKSEINEPFYACKEDTNEVSSSDSLMLKGNTEVESPEESNKEMSKNEDEEEVAIISDSDESDDFVDVAEENPLKNHDKIEIVIKPVETIEDDLFSDIFNSGNDNKNDLEGSNGEVEVNETNSFKKIKITNTDEDDSAKLQKQVGRSQRDNYNSLVNKDKLLALARKPLPSKKIPEFINRGDVDSHKKQDGNNEDLVEKSLMVNEVSNSKVATGTDCMKESEKDNIEEALANLHTDTEIPSGNFVITQKIAEEEHISVAESREGPLEASSVILEKETSEGNIADKANEGGVQSSHGSEPAISRLSIEEMKELKEGLRKQQFQLQTEKSLKERLAGNITDQMYQEAQDLLELFGVPYIIAPMEAEAQCAFLDEIDLTDGTITDDSDIWLFGGKTVYKNFFNQSKHVMEFRSENVLHHFKLTRQQMILLALLVGSDYTTGIQGVGPVTALEILAAFPPTTSTEFSLTQSQLLSGLAEFRTWFNKGKAPGVGQKSLRSKLKNVKFAENFPNIQVVQAYLEPKVETSREKFSWAKPDFVGLVDFARQKFGWTIKKSEEILNPVIKRLEERHSQKTIRDYFKTKTKILSDEAQNKMSKRVKTAVKRIGNEPLSEDEEKPKQKKSKKKINEEPDKNADENSDKVVEKPKRRGRKKKEVEAGKEECDTTEVSGRKTTTRKKKSVTALGVLAEDNDDKIEELAEDEDVKILQATASHSSKRVRQINEEIESEIEKVKVKRAKAPNLHKKEVIPQRERDKTELLRKKLKAIELFRKSQKGPGFVKKQNKTVRTPKEDAGLSESSSDGE